MSKKISRRELFTQTALYGGSALVALHLPRALRAAQESTARLALSSEEWKTVEAITGRIIPTDDDPGALEAGCVNFIDKALAHEDTSLRPQYDIGVRGIDAEAKRRTGKPFAELDPTSQDEVLVSLEAGTAADWPSDEITSQQFFETVRLHTIYGFLADPKYGGNRNYSGWKLVGYPGPRHHLGGYSPEQMLGEAKIRAVWGEDL